MSINTPFYGEVHFDSGQIERWSQLLEEAASELDTGAERRRPEYVDAGPFTPLVEDMVEATVAQYVHLILRLEAAAHKLDRVAKAYRKVEEKNKKLMKNLGYSIAMLRFHHPHWDPEVRDAWETIAESK